MVTKSSEANQQIVENQTAENQTAENQTAGKEIVPQDDEWDWSRYEGAGFEEVDADSLSIPFLRVIQKTSPQMEENNSEYNPDAKAGMFYNTVTRKYYDGKEGVIFLPVYFQRRFICWGPRGTSESGFKGEYLPERVHEMVESGELIEFDRRTYKPLSDGKIDVKKCDQYSDTRSYYILLIEPDQTVTHAMLSMASTQIRKASNILTITNSARINGRKPPIWLNMVRATTAQESNDQGTWQGIIFEKIGYMQNKAILEEGARFYDTIMAGKTMVNYEEGLGDTTREREDSDRF
jgi:hypothetical protein